jgi:hypothetical protein
MNPLKKLLFFHTEIKEQDTTLKKKGVESGFASSDEFEYFSIMFPEKTGTLIYTPPG